MNTTEGAGPRQILVIRHGEKPSPLGRPVGIKEDGSEDHHSLTVRGWQRAGALARFFAAPPDGTMRSPTRIYAPPIEGKDGDHGRPHQTVLPLAGKLGLRVDARFGLDAEDELMADVLASDGVVLISWEHKRIPLIANAILRDETTAPQQWPDDRFDVIWVFDRVDDEGYQFRQVPQLLLAGDRSETFG